MRIGRLVLTGTVSSHEAGSGSVTVGGVAEVGSTSRSVAVEQTLHALADNPDEQAVPLILDDGWSGAGTVAGVSVEPLHRVDGLIRYEVELVPLRGSAAPMVESVLTGAGRDNEHGLTGGNPWHAVPGGTDAWTWDNGSSSTESTWEVPEGEVLYRRCSGLYTGVAQWVAPVDRWYEGAALVEDVISGDPVPVVGRRSLGQWRAGNGLIRCYIDEGELCTEWYVPDTGWSDPQRWHLGSSAEPWVWTSAKVTRNAPEAVQIQVTGSRLTEHGLGSLWITIRRGWAGLDCVLQSSVYTGATRLAPNPTEGVTDDGSRITQAAESGGVRWVTMHAGATSVNTATGALTAVGHPQVWPFGIAAYRSGTGTGDGALANVHLNWYAPQVETVHVGVMV